MDLQKYWRAVLNQNAEEMRTFFHKDAFINWHNTNEHFTVDEFIRANCEYPGDWDGKIERIEEKNDISIVVVHVYTRNRELSFHVTSFIKIENEKIASMDEYWGEDEVPQWRVDKRIGKPISNFNLIAEEK